MLFKILSLVIEAAYQLLETSLSYMVGIWGEIFLKFFKVVYLCVHALMCLCVCRPGEAPGSLRSGRPGQAFVVCQACCLGAGKQAPVLRIIQQAHLPLGHFSGPSKNVFSFSMIFFLPKQMSCWARGKRRLEEGPHFRQIYKPLLWLITWQNSCGGKLSSK